MSEILQISQLGNPILRQQAQPIHDVHDERIQKLIDDLTSCREFPIPLWVGMRGKSIKRFDAAPIDNNLSSLPSILFVLN